MDARVTVAIGLSFGLLVGSAPTRADEKASPWVEADPAESIVADGTATVDLSECTFHGGGRFLRANPTSAPTTFLVHRSILSSCSANAVDVPAPSTIAFSCSDLFGNAGGDWAGNIADQEGVNGNFSADPLFCAATQDNFTLFSHSPCLPGNHPDGADCDVIGAFGEGCFINVGAGEGLETASWARIKSQYRARGGR